MRNWSAPAKKRLRSDCERRREGCVGLFRQQNAVGAIIALLSMRRVANAFWQGGPPDLAYGAL